MTVPFRGKTFRFRQPNGDTIEVRGWGDQHYAVFEDLKGYVVVQDPASGYFQYGALSADGTELVPTGAIAGRVDPAALGLRKNVRIDPSASRARAAAARVIAGRKRRWEERIDDRRRAARMARDAARDGRAFAPPSRETVGDYQGLCILIQFPDVPGTIARDEVDDFCNKAGYSGFGNKGSVLDYFRDVSGGRLRYRNQVTEYYTAEHPRSHYTDESIPQGQRARELIREAIAHLKAEGFDWSALTTDGEGYVRALNVFYAGEVVNNWSKGLWPHSWHLGIPVELAPGRYAFDYQFTAMGSELALGTFCHENGHMICDFPDLYDYGYQSNGVGHYCLMCFGGPDEKNPTQVCAYLKNKAGWSERLIPVAPGMRESLPSERNEFLIHVKDQLQYFIIENRLMDGRDSALPSSGLAIWHVDEEGSNEYEEMTALRHYECSLEQADGKFDLEQERNQGDRGDLFSTATRVSFGDATAPSSRWWDGTPSGLEIRGIGPAGRNIAFETAAGGGEEAGESLVSEPRADIPDHDTRGVEDEIEVEIRGKAAFLQVGVDIEHSYRGDLRVTLLAPSGAAALLHDRHGGRADDLKASYDSAQTLALQNLLGEELRGAWTLRVQDLARADTGRLLRWELTVRPVVDLRVRLEEAPGVDIPDNDPSGIERRLEADADGVVGEIEIAIDLTHTFIRDLVVSLVSPSGTSVDLHRRTGGSADNIIRSWSSADTSALEPLRGEPVRGRWALRVSDHEGADRGKLNRWSLTIVPGTTSP